MLNSNSVESFQARLNSTHPALAKYIVEFAYGEVQSRPGLDIKMRQIATISSLICLGSAVRELKIHINNGLNVGISQLEMEEIIIHLCIYCGFPRSVSAMETALEVFADRALNRDKSAAV